MPESFNDVSVHCLARTVVDRVQVQHWLDELGANEFVIPPAEQVSDPALLVALAAKQCYMSFQPGLNPNINKVRTDMLEYLENVLKQRHGSVLEHAVFTFGINGCSRVFTGEMNRHRPGVAISERSMRYIRYTTIRFWMPTCFRVEDGDNYQIKQKKILSQRILMEQFGLQEDAMAEFAEIWKEELSEESTFHAKKLLTSAFRRIIGMGIATGGVWTLNLRALRHVIAMRVSDGAEEEIFHVVGKIAKYMIEQLPELFDDFAYTQTGALVPQYWKV